MDPAMVTVVVAVALLLGFVNGFLDVPHTIAAAVSTRALTPQVAVVMAVVMNFVGALLGEQVARTVAAILVLPGGTTGLLVLLSALLGALGWNVVTWYLALPSSATHALVGGLVGAALAYGVASGSPAGFVQWDVVLERVVVPMLAAPVAGLVLGFVLMLLVLWSFRRTRPARARRGLRLAQSGSAAALALGHGLQDAQKTMGVVVLALLAGGSVSSGASLPTWVVLSAAAAVALGTLAGGRRVIRTPVRRVIELDAGGGFAAESAAAGTLLTSAVVLGAPVSTTHTLISTVMGAGATRSLSAIRWGVARSVVLTWALTLPAAALLAALVYAVARAVTGAA